MLLLQVGAFAMQCPKKKIFKNYSSASCRWRQEASAMQESGCAAFTRQIYHKDDSEK